MLMRELPFESDPRGDRRGRELMSALLRAASRGLDGLAARLATAPRAATVEPMLEFHADAGALEGALYVDGRLVGHVLGVNRL